MFLALQARPLVKADKDQKIFPHTKINRFIRKKFAYKFTKALNERQKQILLHHDNLNVSTY